ncbi:Spo19p KNAG_0J01490 [Huiozyma naganishii CBS 8797]|uniref:Uncharacterized protein n=1 Tax=Huiozyma naganishii (strain ATCC MYA-139 / BCRC 22969 / CBS 8797 / KCTC 17520 / NBRC 10181 / NCYC 3082 / Yp74L-3) TaxID=1071383 RepID=J7RBH5_HUIN7|nr:hypothetical protein KNAG_0J01490 [Kazachstania naganishii CBS 8797]CCK72230.1 hypothetical protein KNAG_0J01490 [Kazachstania naganishii CBS 8797]
MLKQVIFTLSASSVLAWAEKFSLPLDPKDFGGDSIISMQGDKVVLILGPSVVSPEVIENMKTTFSPVLSNYEEIPDFVNFDEQNAIAASMYEQDAYQPEMAIAGPESVDKQEHVLVPIQNVEPVILDHEGKDKDKEEDEDDEDYEKKPCDKEKGCPKENDKEKTWEVTETKSCTTTKTEKKEKTTTSTIYTKPTKSKVSLTTKAVKYPLTYVEGNTTTVRNTTAVVTEVNGSSFTSPMNCLLAIVLGAITSFILA